MVYTGLRRATKQEQAGIMMEIGSGENQGLSQNHGTRRYGVKNVLTTFARHKSGEFTFAPPVLVTF